MHKLKKNKLIEKELDLFVNNFIEKKRSMKFTPQGVIFELWGHSIWREEEIDSTKIDWKMAEFYVRLHILDIQGEPN